MADKDDKKEEIKPVEEAPKVTPEVTEKVDVEAIRNEIKQEVKDDIQGQVEEVSTKVRQDIIDQIAGGKGQEDSPPWEKEGRQPRNYTEIGNWSKDQALKEFEAKQAEKDKQIEKDKEVEVKDNKQIDADWNRYWDGQLNDMRSKGQIPQIAKEVKEKLNKGEVLTDVERNDKGLVAQKEIFQMANDSKESNLKVVYYEQYQPKSNQPAGADAPISGGTGVSSTSDDYSYDEVHKAPDFESLTKES